jgi:hypothetical protein
MEMYQNFYKNEYAYVNGLEGAKNYQIGPNQTVLLIDSDNPFIYMKCSNPLGQTTLRYFKIEEVKEPKNKTDYVTRADLEELIKELKGVKNESTEPAEQTSTND